MRKAPARPMAACCAAVCLLAAASARAASSPGEEIGTPRNFNWAYAAAYGTGRYRLDSGSTITMLQLPLRWKWHKPDSGRGCRCGMTLLLPVTVGVRDLDLQNLPHRADEVGFFPGLQFVFPRTEHWTLKVTGQIGAGKLTRGVEKTARLYGVGLRSKYAWPDAPAKPALIGGLYWSGYRLEGGGGTHSLARFSSGAELSIAVPRWKFHNETMRLMPHVLADWYFRPADFQPIIEGNPTRVRLEWEVGLAAGREKAFSILGAKFDRVGLAFRFSQHTRGLRLFFSSIF